MKSFILALLAVIASFASFALTPIVGPMAGCVGSSVNINDSLSPGGVWSSSNIAVATVTATTIYDATITAITPGTAVITYSLSGVDVYRTFTVNPLPAPVSGAAAFCVGTTITLSDPTPGGSWSSFSSIASVGSVSGIVTGIHGGVTGIYYTMPGGCSASTTVTVNATFTDSISGSWITSVCPGATITVSDPLSGGTWSSSNTAIATITSGGSVTGVATGSCTISYTVNGSCGLASAVKMIDVLPSTVSPGSITGVASLHIGATAVYTDYPYGGTWSSSNPAIGTIDPTTGALTGIAPGTATISYSVSACSGMVYASKSVTVTSLNGISGHVLFTGGPFYDSVEVYLITYDPFAYSLTAVDSVRVSPFGGLSAYYEFTGVVTDSFRIKAVGRDSTGVYTGYMPTYHTSSFYWHSANVLYHTIGASDVNQDITMSYGTVSTGPGFIGGSISSGANKGTTGDGPAVGVRMFLVNSSTGAMIQQTKTNASGEYKFLDLPYGVTYYVHPEDDGYLTTPYTGITLSAAVPSVSNAQFIEHTLSHTIAPVTMGVADKAAAQALILLFPNPSDGRLNLSWNIASAETGIVTISDITGREVFKTSIDMTTGSGLKQLDIAKLINGLYMISVRSASINYNTKVTIAK